MSIFERFNEAIFESYCKKSISNAIKKEKQKEAARGHVEQPFSALTDAVLYALSIENNDANQIEEPCQIFRAGEISFPVYNQKLSRALSHLMSKDREIILLYFFENLRDVKVASLVHMSRAAVSRRRKAAMVRLRELMEDTT